MANSDVRFVFGVDLDGVCFDYYGAIKPYAAEWMKKRPEDLVGDAVYGFKPWASMTTAATTSFTDTCSIVASS
jgi:hypothetical protein